MDYIIACLIKLYVQTAFVDRNILKVSCLEKHFAHTILRIFLRDNGKNTFWLYALYCLVASSVSKLVTTNEKAEALNSVLPLSSVAASLPTSLEWMDSRIGKGSKVLPTVWKYEVHDLRKLNVHQLLQGT